jgi:hypothetical protein
MVSRHLLTGHAPHDLVHDAGPELYILDREPLVGPMEKQIKHVRISFAVL